MMYGLKSLTDDALFCFILSLLFLCFKYCFLFNPRVFLLSISYLLN